jgi:putative transposase
MTVPVHVSKNSVFVTRRYVWKLYPTAEQQSILHAQRMMMADLWNALKQRHEDIWRRTRGQHGVVHSETWTTQRYRHGEVASKSGAYTAYDMQNEITYLLNVLPEWRAIPAITCHRVAKLLDLAFAAFFRRCKGGEAPGYPKWQRRDRATTIPLGKMDKTGWTFQQREDNPRSWRLHYKSISQSKDRGTWIHARGKLPQDDNCNPIWVEDYRNGDIIWRDGNWWLSVCVDMESRRWPGRENIIVEFDCLDGIAHVNGKLEEADDIIDIELLDRDLDRMQSERDKRFPRGKRRSEAEQEQFIEASAEIAKLSAYIARRRKDFLHVWTARTVARANELTIAAPKVRENTRSAHGDSKQWGANVEAVAELNRHTLAFAPKMAQSMLEYKFQEATGIPATVIEDRVPAIAVGGMIAAAGKKLRRVNRELHRNSKEKSDVNTSKASSI